VDAAAANLDEPPREVAYHRVTTNALLRAAQGLTAGVCVVHLIRAALRFVSYQDRKKMAAGLRRVYTAPTEQAARAEFDELAGSELGKRHPASIAVWQRAWERFTPFLASPRRYGRSSTPRTRSGCCTCRPGRGVASLTGAGSDQP